MRILIYGINYSPELTGVGKYTSEMAEWLACHGHNVRVVTAPPYYPAWQIGEGYQAWHYRREYINNIHVWRCPLWVPKIPSSLKRIVHLISFAVSSLPVLLIQILWRPDILFVVEPPLFCAPQALFVARLSKAKAWLHIQDFELQAFLGLDFGSLGLLEKYATFLEGCLMRHFDHVSSISSKMVDRITNLNVPKKLTSLFPNWVDTKHISPESIGRNLRKEWGLADNLVIILYAGNMGNKQGLEIVIDAARYFQKVQAGVLFLLVGEGANKSNLVSLVNKLGLQNVIFRPLLPPEDLPSLLAMADIHLIVQKRGVADAVLPSKLSGIFAAGGITVITADEATELGQLVLNNPGIAVLAEPENTESIAIAIINIIASFDKKREINSVARFYAEKFLATDVVLTKFENTLYELVHKSKNIVSSHKGNI